MGRIIIVSGLILIFLGLGIWGLEWVGLFGFLGHLPGDLRIERQGFRFYFPVTTCILVSAVLSALVWLFGRWW